MGKYSDWSYDKIINELHKQCGGNELFDDDELLVKALKSGRVDLELLNEWSDRVTCAGAT